MKRCLLLLAYAIPLAILVFILCRLTVNVPYWDDYGAIIGWFAEPWPERLHHLLDFHNEHRLMTARLVFEGIYRILGHFDFRACMAVGAAFLLGYAALIGRMMRPIGRYFHLAFLPCFWLIVSFIQYENLCWAMAAVSNFQVHFWALLSLFAAARFSRLRTEVPAGIACGVLATLSVGGGMAVWPCLALMAALRRRKWSAIAYGLVGALVIALYLRHFPQDGNSDVAFSFVRAILFIVSFVGAWVPFFPAALVVGLVTLGLIAYFSLRLTTLHDRLPLVFAIYLLGNMAAAALFRSGDVHGAISFRYIILPISLLACCVTLVLENLAIPDKVVKLLCGLFMGGSVVYSLGFLAVGGPLFAHRNEVMRRNILCWPEHPEGLRSAAPDVDGERLRKCRDSGVYDPQWVRKVGEELPADPIPWLR